MVSEVFYTLANTIPLWRVPAIAVLFVVIIACFELIYWALKDD